MNTAITLHILIASTRTANVSCVYMTNTSSYVVLRPNSRWHTYLTKLICYSNRHRRSIRRSISLPGRGNSYLTDFTSFNKAAAKPDTAPLSEGNYWCISGSVKTAPASPASDWLSEWKKWWRRNKYAWITVPVTPMDVTEYFVSYSFTVQSGNEHGQFPLTFDKVMIYYNFFQIT